MCNTEFPGHGGKFNLSCQPCEYNSHLNTIPNFIRQVDNFSPTFLPRGLEKVF